MRRPNRLFIILSFCACFLLLFALPFRGQKSKKPGDLNHFSKQSDLINYSRFDNEFTPSRGLLSILERQARWDDAAGNLNPSGLHLRFDKIDEQATPGGRVAERYRVFAEGAPENKVFAFESWPVDKAISADPRNLYVNVQGLLMIHRPKPEEELSFTAAEDEFEVTLMTGSAEPMRFLLSSIDGQLRVFGTLVPHPVVSVDQGCRLEARVAQPDTTAALILLDGFPAKARIPVVLQSEGAAVSEVLTVDSDGHAVMADFPYVPGKAQGTLRATAEGPRCLPSVVLPWGPVTQPAPKTP
jgi:hypothetical protein